MKQIKYQPIGVIHSPYAQPINVPIQPASARGIRGTVELFPDYVKGLKDLEGFSHIILLYHFHLSGAYRLEVKPFLDEEKHGVFATRSPKRPNNIGMSIVRLNGVGGCILHVENMDIVDGTPLLDIKPHVPDFSIVEDIRTGWLAGTTRNIATAIADDRFNF